MKRTTIKLLIIIAIITLIIMSSTYTFAGVTPGDITGSNVITKSELGFIYNIADFVKWIGMFIAVGALMVIGIKYITGSLEEKANYKKGMMPYIIGCFILFGASFITPIVRNTFSNIGTDKESIANSILGLIQVIGTFVSVGVLMILGIKYMIGSVEQRASYKKSMIPYLIGAILIFGAVHITSVIYNTVIHTGITKSEQTETAKNFVDKLYEQYDDDDKIKEELEKEYKRAEKAYNEAVSIYGATSKEATEALQYLIYIQGELGKLS